jgi:hypothetical protein
MPHAPRLPQRQTAVRDKLSPETQSHSGFLQAAHWRSRAPPAV